MVHSRHGHVTNPSTDLSSPSRSIGEPVGVTGERIHGRRVDGRPPRCRASSQPRGNSLHGAALDHIQEAVQLDPVTGAVRIGRPHP
jgi:hypothetical protein